MIDWLILGGLIVPGAVLLWAAVIFGGIELAARDRRRRRRR